VSSGVDLVCFSVESVLFFLWRIVDGGWGAYGPMVETKCKGTPGATEKEKEGLPQGRQRTIQVETDLDKVKHGTTAVRDGEKMGTPRGKGRKRR